MEELAASRVLLGLAVVVLVLFHHISAQQQPFLDSRIERLALLDLRSSLGIRSRDWPIKSDPCTSWNGLQCKNGRVTGINISGFRRTRLGKLNPSFNVDSMANFTFLESFNASGFRLPGSMPSLFGNSLGSLQVLDLRSCSITGPIPDSLGNLTTLNALYLTGNDLTGSVPPALGQLSELSVLELSRNSLTGSIPTSFVLLRNLSRIDLSSNYLSGSIPPGFSNFSGLQFLNLADNSLSGSVPAELGILSQLAELNLSKNSLSSSLPVELSGLRNLEKMDVGHNELEGPLPDGLFSSINKLQVVVFRENKFDGALPSALLSLLDLQFLDVSGNNFTGNLTRFGSSSNPGGAVFNLSDNLLYGTLPSSFGNFISVDLSGNYFRGKIPDSSARNVSLGQNCLQGVQNQRTLEDCRFFYLERGLSFDNFGAPDTYQPSVPESASKKSKRWIYILVGLLGGVAFIVALVLVMVVIVRKFDETNVNQRGSANVGPVREGDRPSETKDPVILSGLGDSFTYEQLLRFTGEFNETNLIKHGHSGDLFRGILEGGTPIVVKKVNLSYLKKEHYVKELEFFSKYTHARLVPLLGHCQENENEKFLVYKYMPNGDLANSLYRVTNSEDDSLQSLDWITRLKIATGAAEALSYLHHECSPPLVHRDVQASSILLDDKFEVRLGSFSEVHVQEGDSHQKVLPRFLRKPSSSEPSTSGSSSISCANDVYCFGKVLLELITGKLGISKSDDANAREWLEYTLSHISMYDKELVTQIVDPSLIIDEDLLEEVWAMAIVARSCLNPKPSKRPPMKYILKALENPLKVVREESNSSGRLRTTSSRRSWSATLFGSWRHSSSDNATVLGHTNREGLASLKQPGRLGSHGSSGIDHSSSNKRLSSEIFPEPVEAPDIERQGEE